MFNLFGGDEASGDLTKQNIIPAGGKNPNYFSMGGGYSKKDTKLVDLIRKGPSVVRYHMNGCGHCVAMEEEWHKLINALNNKAIVIVDLEASALNPESEIVEPYIREKIVGFPTIITYLDGKQKDEYQGDRNKDDIMKWLNTIHGGALKMSGGKKKAKKAKKAKKSKTAAKKTKKSVKKAKKSKTTKKSKTAAKKNKKTAKRKTRKNN
jgi:thioredoxin-like negative regulator of GroEL